MSAAEPGPLPLMIDTNFLRTMITQTTDPNQLAAYYAHLKQHRDRLLAY